MGIFDRPSFLKFQFSRENVHILRFLSMESTSDIEEGNKKSFLREKIDFFDFQHLSLCILHEIPFKTGSDMRQGFRPLKILKNHQRTIYPTGQLLQEARV